MHSDTPPHVHVISLVFHHVSGQLLVKKGRWFESSGLDDTIGTVEIITFPNPTIESTTCLETSLVAVNGYSENPCLDRG